MAIRKRLPNFKKEDTWFNTKWRAAMSWVYCLIVIMDFVIFPILWSLLQAFMHGVVTTPWSPLTSANGGLFHIAMCTVLGISSYTRGMEKIAISNNSSGTGTQSSDDSTK